MDSIPEIFNNLYETIKHLFDTNCAVALVWGARVIKINNTCFLYLGTAKLVGLKDIINYDRA